MDTNNDTVGGHVSRRRGLLTVGFIYFLLLAAYSIMFSDRVSTSSNLSRVKTTAKVANNITCYASGTCLDPMGVVGEWIYTPNLTFAAPVCCSSDDPQQSLAKGQCVLEVGQPFVYSGSELYQKTPGHACSCENRFLDEYKWQSPHLPSSFDPIKTCELLGNRTVLFIGDSSIQQTASTLMNSLVPAGCQSQVIAALSDTLVGRGGKLNRGAGRGNTWKNYLNEIEADIVVVAVGAHIQTDEVYWGIVEEVLNDMQELQRQNPYKKYAWKTQQPGGCTKEIVKPKNATIAASEVNKVGHMDYNWDLFYQRDLELISRLQINGIPYLDMRMLYSRSDAHVDSQIDNSVDCFHFCSPGPLDVVGRLFHQLLLDTDEALLAYQPSTDAVT